MLLQANITKVWTSFVRTRSACSTQHNVLLLMKSLQLLIYRQQKRSLASSFFRNPKRIESYFSAIGGESDDPPPELTPEQVTAILRTNESLILNNKIAAENENFLMNFLDVLESKKLAKNKKFAALRKRKFSESVQSDKLYSLINNQWVSQVESNQLAANHPIEDRLRVSTLNFEPNTGSGDDDNNQSSIILGVFDGHGGGFCADVIVRRLFHYVVIGLKAQHLRELGGSKEEINVKELLESHSTDHTKSPSKFYHNIYTMYEEEIAKRLQNRIEEFEFKSLQQFAIEELERNDEPNGTDPIETLLQRSFNRCDQDLSLEIENNLIQNTSNVMLHYYHSLAVSGCCATIVFVHQNKIYVASSGDCRAVMGLLKKVQLPESSFSKKQLRMIELSREHNSDNVNELNRIYSEHPKEEHNFIIRENRLLGQLMPLRAFGDFSFKWSVEKMKQLGLTRAFGSHIIPTFYRTPPYLTADPEITIFNLEQEGQDWMDRFIVLATDGLWEQFETPRKVVKAVNRYRQNWFKQIKTYTSAQVFNIEPVGDVNDSTKNSLTLGDILDRLSKKVKDGPVTTFERITADDDLIEDINCGTFLLRTALSDISTQAPRAHVDPIHENAQMDFEEEKFSHHVDQYEQQRRRHSKLVSYLTLPQSVVRNFRDDISLIVIGLK